MNRRIIKIHKQSAGENEQLTCAECGAIGKHDIAPGIGEVCECGSDSFLIDGRKPTVDDIRKKAQDKESIY